MRRPACASGAERPLKPAMSKPSRSGSTGLSPRPRSRWRRGRGRALAPNLAGGGPWAARPVMNTPFGNSITTAEHAITLMLALARQIPQADASTQAGKWEKNRFMGVEITGKTLGVIGCGNIGSIVADRGHGLRMKVIAYDPFLSPERARDLGVEKIDIADLFKRADFITLHTPLTDKTKNIVDHAAIATMKKGVRIINSAL